MIGVFRGTRSGRTTESPFCGSRRLVCLLLTVYLGSVLSILIGCQTVTPLIRAQSPDEVDADFVVGEPIVAIRIEGNTTIPASAVMRHVNTQLGRPADQRQIKEDLRALYATRWFFSVEPRYRYSKKGLILVFHVVERPVIRKVEFRGNRKIKTKYLQALTGLDEGSPYDVSANRESVRRIKDHYREKGFPFTKVELQKGDSRDDREVIFQIDEGNKVIVKRTKFTGNKAFRDALLRTKLRTKRAFFGLTFINGKYNPETITDDIASLTDYYHSLGYFDVKIDRNVSMAESRFALFHRNPFKPGISNVTIDYIIDEGMRYKLRNVLIEGNQIFTEEELSKDLEMASGKEFNARDLNKDVEGIRDRYGKLGRLFAGVDAVPRFLEEPGMVDLVYRIDEDRVYRVRRVNVHIRGDNPHTKETVVLNRIVVHPGDLANPKLIKRSETRLQGQIFERGAAGPRVKVTRVKNDPTPFNSVVRGQNYDDDPVLPRPPNLIFENNPYGDPFGRALRQPPGEIDLDYYVTEARTGRLMFGVGFNSDAGAIGSIVLEENNFDILRPPTSFRDLADGGWRGGGQRFRMEAVPGDIVSRYLISWSDPYFLDTDYSFGVSGFYYTRFFPDWDEDRTGGRISLGRQFTPEISLTGSYRLEDVTLKNPDFPTPQVLIDALGSNFFQSFTTALAHDTRDSPYLPSEGHFVQASYEQAFGDFLYPRMEVEGRQYFTTYARPDGFGRHILSLRLQAGWTDSDTPIFERYYAGGFQSFRGFAFRGVSPIGAGTSVRVGGRWQFLGGAQYSVPITADENIGMVFFSDFGTVENTVGLENFRVSVGFGLRLTVPAMGPAPIALDWAIPVISENFDDERLFSFYIGLTR